MSQANKPTASDPVIQNPDLAEQRDESARAAEDVPRAPTPKRAVPTLAENDAEVCQRTAVESVEGRRVITLDQKDEQGRVAYVEVEPLHDPSLYASYSVREVKNAKDEFLDVNVNGDWVRLSVFYEPLTVTEHVE